MISVEKLGRSKYFHLNVKVEICKIRKLQISIKSIHLREIETKLAVIVNSKSYKALEITIRKGFVSSFNKVSPRFSM